MIQFECSGCGKRLAVRDESAGKRVKCPHCYQGMQAPAGPMIPDLLVSPPARARPSPLAPAATPLPPPGAPPAAEAIEPPARKRFFKKNRRAADILGVLSLCLGLGACIMTFLVQLLGGMCCGWLGWPLAIVPIPVAIVTIVLGDLRRHKIMAIIAIVLSVIGVVLAILVLLGLSAALFGAPYMMTPRHK